MFCVDKVTKKKFLINKIWNQINFQHLKIAATQTLKEKKWEVKCFSRGIARCCCTLLYVLKLKQTNYD